MNYGEIEVEWGRRDWFAKSKAVPIDQFSWKGREGFSSVGEFNDHLSRKCVN